MNFNNDKMEYFIKFKSLIQSMSTIRPNIKLLIRLLFMVFGLTVTVTNIKLDLEMYLQRMTKTEMTIENNAATAFPSITICLNSMHSRGKFRI